MVRRFSVRLGEHTISTAFDCDNYEFTDTCNNDQPSIQDIEIDKAVVHENYDRELKVHDIALLILKTEVIFHKIRNIATICLPVSDEQFIENILIEEKKTLNMTIAGWGCTETNERISDFLLKARVPYLTHENCMAKFAEIKAQHSTVTINIRESHLVMKILHIMKIIFNKNIFSARAELMESIAVEVTAVGL